MTLDSQASLTPVSTEYVMALEKRIAQLEGQLLQVRQPQQANRTGLQYTQLLSPNFLSRAFAVWGHMFVAQFLISLVFTCLYLILMALGIGLGGLSLLGNSGN